MNDNG